MRDRASREIEFKKIMREIKLYKIKQSPLFRVESSQREIFSKYVHQYARIKIIDASNHALCMDVNYQNINPLRIDFGVTNF